MGLKPVTSEKIVFIERPMDDLIESFQTVLDYWNRLRADRFAPSWSEFDMMQIPSKQLPSTLVKDVERDPLAFRFRYYGSRFAHLRNKEYTGKTVDDLEGKLFSRAISSSLETFIEQQSPIHYAVEKQTGLDTLTIQLQLRLPISNDGQSVTNVVSLVEHQIESFDYANLGLDGKVPPYFGCRSS